jgi:hypothetical protein
VLHGSIYTPEEIGANVDADGLPIDAPVQPLRVVEYEPVAPRTAAEGRDYLHEAYQAADAAAVRRIWQEAKADGAAPEYLTQIAQVGKEKAAAEQKPAAENAGESDAPEAEANAAERELRSAAAKAGLDNLDEEFEKSYGLPVAKAGASQLREMTAILVGSAA